MIPAPPPRRSCITGSDTLRGSIEPLPRRREYVCTATMLHAVPCGISTHQTKTKWAGGEECAHSTPPHERSQVTQTPLLGMPKCNGVPPTPAPDRQLAGGQLDTWVAGPALPSTAERWRCNPVFLVPQIAVKATSAGTAAAATEPSRANASKRKKEKRTGKAGAGAGSGAPPHARVELAGYGTATTSPSFLGSHVTRGSQLHAARPLLTYACIPPPSPSACVMLCLAFRAHRMLLGACNPLVFPVRVFRFWRRP